MTIVSNFSIIELNCRGINTKLGEIKLLAYAQKPEIIAL